MSYTVLNDRTLWFDGDSTIDPEVLADMVLRGTNISRGVYVTEVTEEIEEFNKISDHPLGEKLENREFDTSWNIPKKYKEMKLRKFLLERLSDEVDENKSLDEKDVDIRLARIDEELEMFYKSNLNMLLRAVIYIVDIFKERDVVWGVGRGSACSSYILYLVGIHDIDSVYYDLEITDFIR